MSTPALNPLVTKIRAAHPGAYDDMDDATLTKRVLAKYPQYSDLAAPPAAGPHVDMQEDTSVPTGFNADAGGKLKGLPGVNPHTPTFQEAKGDISLAALPLAATMSVPQIAGSALGGAAGQYGGKALAKNMGAGDTGQEIAGDVGGLAGGALGGWSGGAVADAIPDMPNLKAKGMALGKVGAQWGVSKIPVVGGAVRRPSYGDAWNALRAKAPAVEVPAAPADNLTPIQRAWVARGGKLSSEPINHGNPVPFRERPPTPVGETIHIQPPAPPVRALPPGQYEAPASPLRPPAQLGSGVIEGEYMPEPQAPVRGLLPRGAIPQRGGFEPNQLALPAKASAIPLPAEFPAARQPVIRSMRTAPAPEIAPAPKPVVNVKPAKVGELLNDSLGGRPLQPNVPLRQQMTAKPPAAVTVPAGHTAVESSAIKSYSYDPASREFQSVTPSGATYIHGDVSPEQVEAFEAADSKGKAFNQLKQNSPLVGKVINGQRVNVQPPRALGSAAPEVATPTKAPAVGEDLTPILQKSLEAAKRKKLR